MGTHTKTSGTWGILTLFCKEFRIQEQEAFRDVTFESSFDFLKCYVFRVVFFFICCHLCLTRGKAVGLNDFN